MRTKVKFSALLLVTLGLGIVIGFLGNGIFVREHFRNLEKMRQGDRVVGMIEQQLKLTPLQKEQVEPVLQKYGRKLRSIHRNFHRELTGTLDSLRNEVGPYLTAEQKRRLVRREGGPGFMGLPIPGRHDRAQRFINHFTEAIAPVGAQADTVRAILKKYASPTGPDGALQSDSARFLRMQALAAELKPHLTEEQYDRLTDLVPYLPDSTPRSTE
ncbi:MAG: hypothetical protein PHC61_15655 [Chitinivibrionales bacterium]|nr:hypothetical protein [Chitinivibrionales bacterium]